MKLASAVIDGQEELLCVSDQGVRRASELAQRYQAGSDFRWTMDALLLGGDARLSQLASWHDKAQRDGTSVTQAPYRLLPPVPNPGKIVCVGLNYRSHAEEANLAAPNSPVLFNKFRSSLAADGATVAVPPGASQIDYEAELVVVIGRPCRGVSEEDALDYVAGYCNGNDLSARDLQMRTSQWLLGKVLDGFAPMGPYLVTADEIPNPDALEIVGKRNGREVQHSNTRHMIFSCRHLISYISQYMTLEPGDIIFTGTPEGVILGLPEERRQWLAAGETFTVAIEGLGELNTTIAG